MTLPTAPKTVFLHPDANPGGKDFTNTWDVAQTALNNLLAGQSNTNTLVNQINQQRLYYVDGTHRADNHIQNSAALTTFGSQAMFPPNYLQIGNVIRLTAGGVLGTDSGAQSVNFNIQLGGVTVLHQTGGFQLTGGILTAGWTLQATMIVVPGSANLSPALVGSNGAFMYFNSLVCLNLGTFPSGIDLTQSTILDVQWQWGTGSNPNFITMNQFIVEVL